MKGVHKLNKYFSIILSIVGMIVVVDTFLAQFFNTGVIQSSFVLIYCISFILISSQFKDITKNKFVMIPLYIMIAQTFISIAGNLL
tara:strand:- start:48 stop:305 length:258 start_codon:yes stop_codon:yes gene_type:complete